MDQENIHGILSIVWYIRKEHHKGNGVCKRHSEYLFLSRKYKTERIDLLDKTLLQFI